MDIDSFRARVQSLLDQALASPFKTWRELATLFASSVLRELASEPGTRLTRDKPDPKPPKG